MAAPADRRGHWLPADRQPKVRNGWLVLSFSLLTVGIYAVAWIYRLQREHPRRRGVDPPARVWLAVYLAFVVVLFAAFIASGYGQWRDWAEADIDQRALFAAALAAAVVFNVWFGVGTVRLTQRLRQLLAQRALRRAGPLAMVLLLTGVGCEMLAMTVPVLGEAGVVELPVALDRLARAMGSFGTGALASWAIVVHGQANRLARAATGERQAAATPAPLP